jgi:hypothetical protein
MRATHHGQERWTPLKAEYICADFLFAYSTRLLQSRGGPYILVHVELPTEISKHHGVFED